MHRRLIPKLALTAALAASCATSTPAPPADPAPVRTPAVAAARPVPVPARTRVRASVAREQPEIEVLEVDEGEATYYASRFDGRRTASGIVFRNDEPWAAHRTYPFGTRLRVTNLRNGRTAIVTVVDRGPFGSRQKIIDVSQSIARELGFIRDGRVPVRVEVLEWGASRR